MNPPEGSSTLSGFISGTAAFLIWGLCPIYWKMLAHIPAFETITHRVVWSFIFLLPVISLQGKWAEFAVVVRSPAKLAILCATTLLVAANWFLFIWAINHDLIIQTSLGYYMNPIVNVIFGVIILGERLNRQQCIAVFTAAAGVLYLTLRYGEFPTIAVAIAVTFSLYGLLRKMLGINAAVGLSIETLLLTLPGAAYLVWLENTGLGTFGHTGLVVDFFLVGTAFLTALPLMLFNIAANRITLTAVGFLQYIAPSVTFLLAVFVYNEPLSIHQLIAFCFIWTALAVYSQDAVKAYRRTHAPVDEVRQGAAGSD